MYKVIFKDNKSWFQEPFQADEVYPAKGWEVVEFETYEEAEGFISDLVNS